MPEYVRHVQKKKFHELYKVSGPTVFIYRDQSIIVPILAISVQQKFESINKISLRECTFYFLGLRHILKNETELKIKCDC